MGWVLLLVWASFSWCQCVWHVDLLSSEFVGWGSRTEKIRIHEAKTDVVFSNRGLRQASFTSAIGTEMPRSFQCLQSFCVMNCKTFARQSMPGRRCATLIRLVCGSRPGASSSVASFHLQNWQSFDIERCEGRGFLGCDRSCDSGIFCGTLRWTVEVSQAQNDPMIEPFFFIQHIETSRMCMIRMHSATCCTIGTASVPTIYSIHDLICIPNHSKVSMLTFPNATFESDLFVLSLTPILG